MDSQHKVLLLPKKTVIETDIFILGLSSAVVNDYNLGFEMLPVGYNCLYNSHIIMAEICI